MTTPRRSSLGGDDPFSLKIQWNALVYQRNWVSVVCAMVVVAMAVLLSACSTDTAVEAAGDASSQVEDSASLADPTVPEPTEPTEPSAEPTAASAAEGGPTAGDKAGTQPATTDRTEAYTTIRDVDFLNGFTYETGLEFVTEGASTRATVTDGSYQQSHVGDDDYFWFGVDSPEYGDLDGDRTEEAIVSTTWNGGGSGYFDSVNAYRLVDGAVEHAGRVQFGDRGDGGIHDVRIEDGIVNVWSFSTTQGACCPNEITNNRLVLGDHFLVFADRGETRTWLSSNSDGEELKFLPGTSSAVVVVYGTDLDAGFRFEAGAGQRLTLRLSNGPAATDLSVTVLASGEIMSGLADMVLPVDGYYEVSVTFDEERTENTWFEVIIDEQPEPSVRWVPETDQVVVSDEPSVHTSLVWPEFVAAQPGTEAANTALAAYVSQLDDDWLLDVTEHSEPQDDSSYEVSYDVTLVTDDLVSVRFDYYDYVCCRPYPNYGTRAAIVDLAAGRLIEINEILDGDRMDEVIDIWIRELENQGLLPEGVADLLGARPEFDALTLVPGGVEFGTDRNSLGGGMPGTATFVSFDQLGDLIDPALVARATAG